MDPVYKRRYPLNFKGCTNTTSEAELADTLPPGYRPYRDEFNCRWQVQLRGGKQHISRSWGKYGFAGAATEVCKAAWQHYVDQGNGQCPLVGLLGPAASSSAASGSGSSAPPAVAAPKSKGAAKPKARSAGPIKRKR